MPFWCLHFEHTFRVLSVFVILEQIVIQNFPSKSVIAKKNHMWQHNIISLISTVVKRSARTKSSVMGPGPMQPPALAMATGPHRRKWTVKTIMHGDNGEMVSNSELDWTGQVKQPVTQS